MKHLTFTSLFPFCGLGAGAKGFLDAEVVLLGRRTRFRSLGGIDTDKEACADFERLTKSPALCADIATLTTDELRAFAGPTVPDVIFTSPPCKGFSGLLSKEASKKPKYQVLNELVIQWLELVIATWEERPRLILFENVPRIKSRGKGLLDRAKAVLEKEGYKFDERTHDCGELGGLAQHRRRYLLVARLPRRCPPFLYQPPHKRVRGCGEVLGQLPLPNDPSAGPMHKLPKISWLNWVRLALIPAGGDWRDLPGVLEGRERREVHKRHGVAPWDEPTGTVAGSGSNGVSAVADPRPACLDESRSHHNLYTVAGWDDSARTVMGATRVGSGALSVADPRPATRWNRGVLGVRGWNDPSWTITGRAANSTGPFSVADPRPAGEWRGDTLGVRPWDQASGTVTGRAHPSTGRFAVADPRIDPRVKWAFDHGYRVLHWAEPSFTVAGKSSCGTGAYQVADPRGDEFEGRRIAFRELMSAWDGNPKKAPPFTPVIICPDGCWHRPMTTLELAALQGLPVEFEEKPLELEGRAVGRWRERIGNAVPVQTAEAIGRQMLVALTEAAMGQTSFGSTPVWVTPEREVVGG